MSETKKKQRRGPMFLHGKVGSYRLKNTAERPTKECEVLTEWRKKLGLSQLGLDEYLNVAHGTVCKYERGQVAIPEHVITKAKRGLGLE